MTAKGQWFLPALTVLGVEVIAHDVSTGRARCGANIATGDVWQAAKHCGAVKLCRACMRCAAYDRRGAELVAELMKNEAKEACYGE